MKGNFIYTKIGKRISQERKKRRLTQDDLAYLADMDRTYLTRLERGHANPSIRMLYKIARKLRIKIAHIVKDV